MRLSKEDLRSLNQAVLTHHHTRAAESRGMPRDWLPPATWKACSKPCKGCHPDLQMLDESSCGP